MSSNMVRRVAFAAVAIPVALALVWFGGWVLAAAVAILGALGAREVYDLARRAGVEALRAPGLLAALAIPVIVLAAPSQGWFLGIVWLLALPALAMARGPGAKPLAAVSVTAFGALYASGSLAFLLPLREDVVGPLDAAARTALVAFPLALTWLCDTAAMTVGRAVGGAKMAPVLSPNKTWAGGIGGAVAALAGAGLVGLFGLNRLGWTFTLPQLLGVGLVVSVLGQLGDVAESLFKREVGVKDSSDLLPGHGGILDRLDSLYFVIPATAVLFRGYGIL